MSSNLPLEISIQTIKPVVESSLTTSPIIWMLLSSFTLHSIYPPQYCSIVFRTCWIKHNTLLKPLGVFWERDGFTAGNHKRVRAGVRARARSHTHNTTATALRPFSFLTRLCLQGGLEDNRSYRVRLRQVQPTHQSCVRKSGANVSRNHIFSTQTGKKQCVCVCAHRTVCNCLYSMNNLSSCIICNSSLLVICYFYLSVSSLWQSHVNSLIQHLMTW